MSDHFAESAAPEKCPATVLVKDTRHGGFVDQCDLRAGHEGSHEALRLGCEPTARLAWDGSYAQQSDGSATP